MNGKIFGKLIFNKNIAVIIVDNAGFNFFMV